MSSALALTIFKHQETADVNATIQTLSSVLKKVEGVQAVFWGPAQDHDAPNTAVLATLWSKYASAIAFVQSQAYISYVQTLESITVEKPKTTHCLLTNPKQQLETLFTAAAIEMAPILIFHDKVWQHYHNFETAGKMIAKAPGYVAQFQAPQVEDVYTQWSLVGWDSIELHHDFQKTAEFPSFLELVGPNVDLPGPPPIIHVHFKLVEGSL